MRDDWLDYLPCMCVVTRRTIHRTSSTYGWAYYVPYVSHVYTCKAGSIACVTEEQVAVGVVGKRFGIVPAATVKGKSTPASLCTPVVIVQRIGVGIRIYNLDYCFIEVKDADKVGWPQLVKNMRHGTIVPYYTDATPFVWMRYWCWYWESLFRAH